MPTTRGIFMKVGYMGLTLISCQFRIDYTLIKYLNEIII